MGLSTTHLLLLLLVIVLLFGRGKIADLMGDVGRGIRASSLPMNEETPAVKPADPKVIDQPGNRTAIVPRPAKSPAFEGGFGTGRNEPDRHPPTRKLDNGPMFDISWSELLILAVVTLIFVGPKDLPRFLAFVGKWAGVAKRQASEFRQVFDQAMREAELDQMRREVEEMQANIERTVKEADRKTAEAQAAAEAAPSIAAVEPPNLRPGPEVVPSEPETTINASQPAPSAVEPPRGA